MEDSSRCIYMYVPLSVCVGVRVFSYISHGIRIYMYAYVLTSLYQSMCGNLSIYLSMLLTLQSYIFISFSSKLLHSKRLCSSIRTTTKTILTPQTPSTSSWIRPPASSSVLSFQNHHHCSNHRSFEKLLFLCCSGCRSWQR